MPNRCLFDECFLPQNALEELTKALPTPFYLYDEMGLRQTAQRIFKAFSWNAHHRQYFPVRQAPNPHLLKILREEGCGVQCGSLAELLLAEQCGYSGAEIIFAPMYPDQQELATMKRLGAALLLDNEATADCCAKADAMPSRVILRYNPGGKFSVGQQAIARLERAKLGMPKQELIPLAKKLRQSGVQKLELEADLTKQAMEPDYCAAVAKLLCELADDIKQQTGTSVDAINLGDGIGLAFVKEKENPDILVQGERTRLAMQTLNLGGTMPIHTSIGRLLTGPNALLVSRVLCVKQTHRTFVVLDAAISNFMRSTQGAFHHVSVVGKIDNKGRVYCDVVGKLSELDGRFVERRLLPPVEAGDCCVIHDAGFSGSSMETNYGGVPHCAEYLYTTEGKARLIRPAQSVEDCIKAW